MGRRVVGVPEVLVGCGDVQESARAVASSVLRACSGVSAGGVAADVGGAVSGRVRLMKAVDAALLYGLQYVCPRCGKAVPTVVTGWHRYGRWLVNMMDHVAAWDHTAAKASGDFRGRYCRAVVLNPHQLEAEL